MDSGKMLAAWEKDRRAEQARRAQVLNDLRWLHARFEETSSRHEEESYDELCRWVGLTLRQMGNVSLANRWDWVHRAIAGATTNVTDLRDGWDRIDPASLTNAELDRLLMVRATLMAAFGTYDKILGEVSAHLNLGGSSGEQAVE